MFNNIVFCSTILYEIFTGKWPLNFPTHSIIWMIGKGQQESVTHLQCPESFKVRLLISQQRSRKQLCVWYS